jgi:hypothetical protein
MVEGIHERILRRFLSVLGVLQQQISQAEKRGAILVMQAMGGGLVAGCAALD